MSILKSRSVSHKSKRAFAFKSWRRYISGKEKWFAKQPKKVTLEESGEYN